MSFTCSDRVKKRHVKVASLALIRTANAALVRMLYLETRPRAFKVSHEEQRGRFFYVPQSGCRGKSVNRERRRYATRCTSDRIRPRLVPDSITRSHTRRAQAGSHVYDVLSNFWAQSQPVCARDEPMKDGYYSRGSHAFLHEPFPLAPI